ncbi:unnamed protein product, partial [Ectocarpus sp. 13 AM-2016]
QTRASSQSSQAQLEELRGEARRSGQGSKRSSRMWEGAWGSYQEGGGRRKRDGERVPLAPSSGQHASGGATDGATIPATGGGSGGGSTSRSPQNTLARGDSGLRSREAKPRSSPKKGFLRGMMMPARLKMKHQGGGDSATAA